MIKCVLNSGKKNKRQPKWVVMAHTLTSEKFIEWMHITKAYKHPKRKNYSKNFHNEG